MGSVITTMYICLCNALTERHVHAAASAGVDRPSLVYGACGCTVQCGGCAPTLRRILNEVATAVVPPGVLAGD
jgi:bacterioferritin-associated ferredoxin